MSDEFDFDFDITSNKTVYSYLKKGSGKRMTNAAEEKEKYEYLRKGGGSLASDYHGETDFSRKRAQDISDSQFNRESFHYRTIEEMNEILKRKKDEKK